jgi:hypothetical protein
MNASFEDIVVASARLIMFVRFLHRRHCNGGLAKCVQLLVGRLRRCDLETYFGRLPQATRSKVAGICRYDTGILK